ncbi:MAG: MnhB domain-containing protein [Acidobacteriaceae bacterium]
MSAAVRVRLFLVAGAVFFLFYCLAARNLAPWGQYRGPYGDAVSRVVVYQRHATDVVNAITYDYRGFDTLGEEFILFSAVAGVMMLLRKEDRPHTEQAVHDYAALSEATKLFSIPAIGVTVLFGLYIATHGQLTPGGGFQGGVILAAAPMLIYVSQNTQVFQRITSHPLMEFMEALGAAAYALIGLIPLVIGLPFLTNILPLGKTGEVFSAGTIALISVCVGVEVTAAFILVIYAYLQEIIKGAEEKE